MKRLYSKYMFEWEERMTTRDNNRMVRPFDWGLEWARDWPVAKSNGFGAPMNGNNGHYVNAALDPESYLLDLNRRILHDSERFFGYESPTDFALMERVLPHEREGTKLLSFTSAVKTPYPVNNVVSARWYPAREHNRRAVVLLPHWNSKPHSYVVLCRILAKLGISTLRMSLPYHDARLPAETTRSDYAVSSNIARTIDATRQAVIDARSCFDWLQQQGCDRLGIVGTSLGSCYAFLTSAHDPRIRVNAFNHASTYFADVVWTGQSTRHVRAGIEPALDCDRLRNAWGAISPMNYFHKFAAQKDRKKVLVIYATYDLTFLPDYSKQVVAKFAEHGIDHESRVLPCGHYSTGETPFKYIDGWHIGKFLKSNL
jgi:dienelactone hydrolase